MPSIQVRHVPEEVLAALKRRARRNRRSMQQEILHLLESAAAEVPPDPAAPLRLHLSAAEPCGAWGRDEIYDDDGR